MQLYIGLGSNLGDKARNLQTAVQKIEERIGNVVSLSAFHVTAPWGFDSPNSFLNAACRVETPLPPLAALRITQAIEREMGRTAKSVGHAYQDRTIDIDLLMAIDDDGTPVTVDTPELKLPHPLMHERAFVMQPLAEVLPPGHSFTQAFTISPT